MLKKPKRISTHPNLLFLYHRSSGHVYWISPFLGIKLGQFLCERSITCTPNSNPFWTQYLQWKCDVYIQWNAKRMHGNVTKYMLDVNVGFFKKSQELFFESSFFVLFCKTFRHGYSILICWVLWFLCVFQINNFGELRNGNKQQIHTQYSGYAAYSIRYTFVGKKLRF